MSELRRRPRSPADAPAVACPAEPRRGDTRSPTADERAPTRPYAVVHLVSQEGAKPLIGPQVVDHMAWQQRAEGAGRPERVGVALLEAARVAVRPAMRSRAAELQARAPLVPVALVPYVSRLGIARWGALIARRVARLAGGLPVVLHCRGESAVAWGAAVRRALPEAGIVADIRGPWPEEFLFARGFDGPQGADPESLRIYHILLARLHEALAESGAVLSVSQGMLDWLHQLGVNRDRLTYVPCCVPAPRYSPQVRADMRRALGLEGRLVLTYLGIVTRYQAVEGAVIPFVREAMRQREDAHFLALTPDPEAMASALDRAGIAPQRRTVRRVPQEEVWRHLCAADAGLLLRERNWLTRVVQPVKLAEYLAAGVPVVVSRGTGRVDEMVERDAAGVVVNYTGTAGERLADEVARVCAELTADAERLRAGALRLCEREFLWSRYTDVVRGAYRRALDWDAAVRRARR